jgi:hypothetical protein
MTRKRVKRKSKNKSNSKNKIKSSYSSKPATLLRRAPPVVANLRGWSWRLCRRKLRRGRCRRQRAWATTEQYQQQQQRPPQQQKQQQQHLNQNKYRTRVLLLVANRMWALRRTKKERTKWQIKWWHRQHEQQQQQQQHQLNRQISACFCELFDGALSGRTAPADARAAPSLGAEYRIQRHHQSCAVTAKA